MNPQTHLVTFHKKKIIVFSDDFKQFVAIKPVCENIGIQWEAQLKRLKRDEKFNSTMSIMDMVGSDGKRREMVCLPLEVFPGWLYTINTSRIRNKVTRKMLVSYQLQATRVLYEHFMLAPRRLQKDCDRLERENDRLKANFIPEFIEEKRNEIFMGNIAVFYQSQWFWRLMIHFKGELKDVTDVAGLFVSTLRRYVRRYRIYLRETRHIHLLYPKSHYDGYTAAELAPAFIHAGLDFWQMFYRNDPELRHPDKIISKYEADRFNTLKLGGK